MLEFSIPEPLGFLLEPARYKICHGGRGGGKSWSIARTLLFLGWKGDPLRILCAREFQNSIDQSVHKLLADQIEELGLQDFYQVQNTRIVGANGTEFTFAGLRHNVDSLRSKEGIDIVWVEEAANVSKASWDKLVPTIRKEGSEIWVSFNPMLAEDETYQRFIIKPPASAKVVELNYDQNPWFPKVLEAERLDLKIRDPDAYLNVWEGKCRVTLDGAIYATEIRNAMAEGRITRVPYDHSKPVHTFWDLGHSDFTAIWFIQHIGLEYHAIDYLQDRHAALDHYLRMLQTRGYVYGIDHLPHDGSAKQLAAGGRSIEMMMRAAGRKTRVIQRVHHKYKTILAARAVFPQVWFDEDKCADGLMALRHYRYDVDPETGQFSKEPLHDANSDGADAFGTFALAFKGEPPPKRELELGYRQYVSNQNQRWLGA